MSMDLAMSDDLAQILGAAQSMLDTHYPVARLRDAGAAEPIAPLAEFGTFLLARPEAEGGAGFSLVEEAQLHATFGRHLAPPAALAGAVAMRLAPDDLAQRIGDGAAVVCCGVGTARGALLFDADAAEYALIRDEDGLLLHPLQGAALEAESAMGHGRAVQRLAEAPPASASAGATGLLVHGLLCSAHLLGVAQGARDLAVAYAQTREQFGRPIGSFQAIKHACADMCIGIEMLSAQLDMAAIALRDGSDDAAFQVAALARLAPRIALATARAGIQIHGGIGFSAEADAQLFVKHAHLMRSYLGRFDLLAEPSPMAPIEPEAP